MRKPAALAMASSRALLTTATQRSSAARASSGRADDDVAQGLGAGHAYRAGAVRSEQTPAVRSVQTSRPARVNLGDRQPRAAFVQALREQSATAGSGDDADGLTLHRLQVGKREQALAGGLRRQHCIDDAGAAQRRRRGRAQGQYALLSACTSRRRFQRAQAYGKSHS